MNKLILFLELKNVMNYFTTPLLQICKAIYTIGMSCATMTTDIQSVISDLNGYIVEKQLNLQNLLTN